MNQKSKYLFILLFISLLGLFGLQILYGLQIYKEQVENLKQELDRYSKVAVQRSHTKRIDKVNALFAKDIYSKKYASLSLRTDDNKTRLFIRDINTELDIMAINYPNAISDSSDTKKLKNFLISRNRENLDKGEIMFWTVDLGNRLKFFNDSIKIEKSDLKDELSSILTENGITNQFTLHILETKSEYESDWPVSISSTPIELPLMNGKHLQVNLQFPEGIIFKRIGILVISSVLILFLIFICLILLIKNLNKQRKLSKLKDDFIANVTHELLTPLSSQRLALERLKKEGNLSKNPMVQVMDQQTNRFEEIIDQTLKASFKPKVDKADFETIDLRTLIEEIVTYQKSNIENQVTLHVFLPEDFKLISSKNVIQQVLHNLVNNAVNYNDNEVIELTMTYKSDKEFHYISLKDNGIGITKTEQSLIFEKFHRIQKSGTYRNKGLGVGLFYSKQLLNQIQGDLILSKSSKNGSTFTIKLQK